MNLLIRQIWEIIYEISVDFDIDILIVTSFYFFFFEDRIVMTSIQKYTCQTVNIRRQCLWVRVAAVGANSSGDAAVSFLIHMYPLFFLIQKKRPRHQL